MRGALPGRTRPASREGGDVARIAPIGLVAAVLLWAAPTAHAQATYGEPASTKASVPPVEALYADGVQGKRLLGGTWQFRREGETAWRPVGVPYVWNADDLSLRSMLGGVGWFRKDFVLPSDRAARAWALRFEAANYTVAATLNGKPIGTHSGAHLRGPGDPDRQADRDPLGRLPAVRAAGDGRQARRQPPAGQGRLAHDAV